MSGLEVIHEFAALFVIGIEDQFNKFRAVREITICDFRVAVKNKIPKFWALNNIDSLNGPSEFGNYDRGPLVNAPGRLR